MSEKTVDVKKMEEIANRTRINVVKMIARSGIGHLGGSVSIAEILAVLYFHEMKIDPKNPEWEDRDRFVLSKGHGCPALYATFAEVGFIPRDMLMTLHEIDSPLQMHPELGLCPGIEMSTGALGQGLSAGAGMAVGARLRGRNSRVYVLVGCGECNEGQIWEAAMFASKNKLDNLVAIIDYNKLALSGRRPLRHPAHQRLRRSKNRKRETHFHNRPHRKGAQHLLHRRHLAEPLSANDCRAGREHPRRAWLSQERNQNRFITNEGVQVNVAKISSQRRLRQDADGFGTKGP
jgi:transketolase N-terminal domain/subunit